jgi:pimeloyl-ACP methyl ester carboxylesterase
MGSSRRGVLPVLALVTASALLTGCNRGEQERAAAIAGSRPVSFESTDGVHLEGRLFGQGNRAAVVLSHMLPADQSSWWEFAERLADAGYLVLTYDFRGFCPGGREGCSGGDRNIAAIWQDVLGAIGFVRSQGAARVTLAGASMGGTASLVAAAQPDADVAAVVTLSAPTEIEGLVAGGDVLSRLSGGKLFIAGIGDANAARSAEQLYELAPPPKRVEIVPANDHGTDLLTGSQAEVVRTLVLNYLEQFRAPPA